MSQTTTAARPYARAAFDLARQTARIEAWAEFLARLDALSEMTEVQKLIAQPGVDKTRLASVLAEAAQADDS
ncbi:MAG: F0F1 ATP synthase subunit delta, partial [Algiphilus sp.]